MTLTAKGAEVLPRLTQAFDLLGDAAQALRQSPGMGSVRIAALPAGWQEKKAEYKDYYQAEQAARRQYRRSRALYRYPALRVPRLP